MPNVVVHQFEGSDVSCKRCQLPRKNQSHQPDNTTLILVTYPDGSSEEFWSTELTLDAIRAGITGLIAESVVSADPYDEPTYLEDPDVTD